MTKMKNNDEFTVYLISSASLDLYESNTLACFTNHLAEPMYLEGDWRVALTEIQFPSSIANVTDTEFFVYYHEEEEEDTGDSDEKSTVVRGPTIADLRNLKRGFYDSADKLLASLSEVGEINFKYEVDEITGNLDILFDDDEGFSFKTNQIPGLLGIEGTKDVPYPGWTHIGYKKSEFARIFRELEPNRHIGTLPVDITSGVQMIFIYLNIIQYQHTGDSKAPLLRVIDSNIRLKNGSACAIEPVHRKVFSNLEFKKLLTNSIRDIKVELRTETGKLVPFLGTGKVVLTLQFKKF